jgi:hypothetical protein
MRTTLTLDDDVAQKLKRVAHQRKVPFKQVVNDLLRRGLAAQEIVPRGRRFRIQTFASPFRPGIDPRRLNQLVDELEVADRSGRE